MASRRFVSLLLMMLGVVATIVLIGQKAQAKPHPPRDLDVPRQFKFKIDDAMPLHELLPAPPKSVAKLPGLLNEDLALVPELFFGEPVYKAEDTEEKMAHIMAKINRLNSEGTDGFMKTLLANRADLRGMPFLMGKECRTEEKQAMVFAQVVAAINAALRRASEPGTKYDQRYDNPESRKIAMAERFWEAMPDVNSANVREIRLPKAAGVDRVLVSALAQVVGPRPEPYRVGLTKYLASIKHHDATRALANLALFASEETVRAAAIDGLKSRKGQDYADVLLKGFRYPLPAVSKRAADALVKLQAKDALADLVNVLEQPDPRAPVKQQIDGKQVSFVRELVRVNHHHNCLLCHAPANTGDVPQGVLTAPVPLPDRALPSGFEGYGRQSSPDIFVRSDITYLRQDFSLMMKVENAKPWPEMQRFDFFVRTRQISAEEAADYDMQFANRTPPSHAAAQYALRALTGQTADLTPQAWRELLKSAE